jgi:hypothetical protein
MPENISITINNSYYVCPEFAKCSVCGNKMIIENSRKKPVCYECEMKQFHLFYGDTCRVKSVKNIGKDKCFYIWETPYHFRAMTIADMDYGDR